MTIFDFGRSNRLGLAKIVSDDDFDRQIGVWLSGRLLGRYVSLFVPWRRRLR